MYIVRSKNLQTVGLTYYLSVNSHDARLSDECWKLLSKPVRTRCYFPGIGRDSECN
jgi:hypothetical protein